MNSWDGSNNYSFVEGWVDRCDEQGQPIKGKNGLIKQDYVMSMVNHEHNKKSIKARGRLRKLFSWFK